MNNGEYIFSQLISFLPQKYFYRLSSKYKGDKYSKHFSSWNQLLCMVFGQLSNRNSLRDLVLFLNAHSEKSYHLGLGKSIQLNNFSHANEKRPCKIFEEYMNKMISIAKEKVVAKDFEIKGKIYAFDSSTIDLCLSFYWAKFRSTKNGIKLHTLYDTQASIPENKRSAFERCFSNAPERSEWAKRFANAKASQLINITEAKVNDVNGLDFIDFQAGSYYILDRGYLDFKRLFRIEMHEAYFVTRTKKNTIYKKVEDLKYEKGTGILSDKIIKLRGYHPQKYYPKNLQKVIYHDSLNEKYYEFITNNFALKAEEIALLYKQRWGVELFFKWIKQHLKIKKYWGENENAVRIQIYCAITTYCLVAIIKAELKLEKSTYEILRILSASLLDKTPIYQLLAKIEVSAREKTTQEQLFLL